MTPFQSVLGALLLLSAASTFTACTDPGSEPSEKIETAPAGNVDTLPSAVEMPVRYCTYNEWANERTAAWLATATEEAMTREIESSFKNLRKTALHIWSAEYLWLQVLKDEPYDANPTKDFEGNTDELIKGWLEASAAFRAYAERLDESELSGTRGSTPLAVTDIIQHCMNHSTYHRGQLITMGRQAGLTDPPQTDFIHYVRRMQNP